MSERRPEDDTIDAAGVERLRAALRDEAVGEGGPVDEDRVWRAVTGELPVEERREVIERVAADPAWARAWRLAKELSQAAKRAEAEPAQGAREASVPAPPGKVLPLAPRRNFFRERPVWGAMAAMLVVLVGAVVVLRQQRQQPQGPELVRGGGEEAITSAVPESSALPREGFTLRWSGVPRATGWSVQVSSEDLKLFHRAERLDQREYTVPASVLEGLPSGTRILWQVEARLPDGSVRRGSTFVNRLQ